ncbi:hypothetical protein DNU06_07225 [Putridiphycobacter roseus]|uniref:Uncharacterized protein n=1 Tax=Putridiphycobacter roseus TaxID=2219161 RepID=A0A2W1NET7_9FLAO|nr:hypothetical protein [Putridiphycobacter roseus]PZE17613.1 hypothetical protein DNU06_07225 [Putridiphycobacter roseus]
MAHFFSIIYIKTNRLSKEQIAVGILMNAAGVPSFDYSISKLNFALKLLKPQARNAIKRSLNLLQNDVNKIINGETTMDLFDAPYAKKILDKLILKKGGLLLYGEIIHLEKPINRAVLFSKYIGGEIRDNQLNVTKAISFKKEFQLFAKHKRLASFSHKTVLTPQDFPTIISNIRLDLFRSGSSYTVFNAIDFTASTAMIQKTLNNFNQAIVCLNKEAIKNGLSKGRYYLVYKSTKDPEKADILKRIKNNASAFELIQLKEILDKI